MRPIVSGIGPIYAAPLLRKVDEKLVDLLVSLAPQEWEQPTVVTSWTVRDVAAHLLDTPLRKLSMARDSCFIETAEIRSHQDLVRLVNRLNQEGVTVYRRLSPAVLIDMMRVACDQSARFHESLDPLSLAKFAVSWAGEETSLNWFDTARELTERWHHQQQIRLATNRPGIMTPYLYNPVLDCFMRGLPYAYRNVNASTGTAVLVEVSGECGGKWFLLKEPAGWTFAEPSDQTVASRITIPQEIAWQLFTKGITRDFARDHIEIQGNRELGEIVFEVTAIVAQLGDYATVENARATIMAKSLEQQVNKGKKLERRRIARMVQGVRHAQAEYATFNALDPFFHVVLEGLSGLVDGKHYFDTFADHAVYESRYNFPGWSQTIRGRADIMAAFSGYGNSIQLHRGDSLVVHPARDTRIVILEYEVHGKILATGAPYDNRFISIITIEQRKIVHWRGLCGFIGRLDGAQ